MRLWRGYARHALSGKLILLFVVFTLLSMILVGASIRHGFRAHFKENVRPHLVQYLEYVQQDLGLPPDHRRAQELADRLNIEIHIIDKTQQWSTGGQPVDMEHLEVERRHQVNGREYLRVESEGRDYLMMRYGDSTLLFNVPNVRQEREGGRGLIPLAVLLLLLMGLYLATRYLIAPIKKIQNGVSRFGAGDLDHRIEVHRRDELGELAGSVNAMADDIRRMLDAKRQLLLAISHELRTPLTRARVATELMEDESLKGSLIQDMHEMEALLEEVMEAERLSTRHAALNRGPQDLAALVRETRNSFFRDSDVALQLPDGSVPMDVDAGRIRLMLKNLIDNALRHSPEGVPPPRVLLSDCDKNVIIEVRDQGSGIEARHLPYLTEAFYRVDPARQRETGGYGLGLYLCRMIAEAHGGSLSIKSELGQGTTVTIMLPKGQTD